MATKRICDWCGDEVAYIVGGVIPGVTFDPYAPIHLEGETGYRGRIELDFHAECFGDFRSSGPRDRPPRRRGTADDYDRAIFGDTVE